MARKPTELQIQVREERETQLERHEAAFFSAFGLACESQAGSNERWGTVGLHLREIKDRRLFYAAKMTWDEYCLERLNMSKRRANQILRGQKLLDSLPQPMKGKRNALPSIKDRHARTIATLGDPTDQANAVDLAQEAADLETGDIRQRHVDHAVKVVLARQVNKQAKKKNKTPFEQAMHDERPVLELMAIIQAVRKKVEQFAKTPYGSFLGQQEADIGLKDTWNAVKFCQPYGACPYCGGDGCKKCRDQGWLPKAMWLNTPEELRSKAQRRGE